MRLAFLYIARHSFCRSVYFFASMDRWNSQTNKREFLFRTQLSEIGGQKSQKKRLECFSLQNSIRSAVGFFLNRRMA